VYFEELIVLMDTVSVNYMYQLCCYKWNIWNCFSVDYISHPLEKHYVHQGEKYRPPDGEMDMVTNYTREYTSVYHVIVFNFIVDCALVVTML